MRQENDDVLNYLDYLQNLPCCTWIVVANQSNQHNICDKTRLSRRWTYNIIDDGMAIKFRTSFSFNLYVCIPTALFFFWIIQVFCCIHLVQSCMRVVVPASGSQGCHFFYNASTDYRYNIFTQGEHNTDA